ncbi:GGDEF domain-containing protein [Thermovirga sp.]|uniref:GGDEF domain-containing protein n=1 Tax=Thermovirga sp. TaxID=2699834 RepID=UPI0025DC0F76|nr:GGDEF domain-containing protein [Thermovirga sp.]MBO8153940.1 diguanylate cyclase [Thermovirga sp.]
MQTDLLLSVSLRYWQDFQDTLAEVVDANIYVFDAKGNIFSSFSKDVAPCKKINQGNTLSNEECINFYKGALVSLKDKNILTCPYGNRLYVYPLGSSVHKIGSLVVAPKNGKITPEGEGEKSFIAKANNISQTVNEVLKAILEKNLLGLRSLELNSIYEISRLMTSTIELEKVIDLITNSLIIIYRANLAFVGLREDDKIKIAKAKGKMGELLTGKEFSMLHPLMEKVFSKVEPSFLSMQELQNFIDFSDLKMSPEDKILLYPLWTSVGSVGLLGITFPTNAMSGEEIKNLQIYVNFAAISLANARLITRLEKEAETDFLTGLYNKRSIINLLISERERTIRYKNPLAVIFIDIDDFKSYNDAFGHVAGDVVLQRLAEVIKNSIRKIDIAGRYGGEEFVLILPGTQEEGALAVAERIRKSIAQHPFPHRNITVSSGVTMAQEGDSAHSLLERADRALYKAKRQGKNCSCLI